MTPDERKVLRDKLLISYMDAVDDRKAHCGRLASLIAIFRHVVRLHDEGNMQVQMNGDSPPTFEDGSVDGYRLPSHEDVVSAFIECQKAKQREELRRTDAANAGVDRGRLVE